MEALVSSYSSGQNEPTLTYNRSQKNVTKPNDCAVPTTLNNLKAQSLCFGVIAVPNKDHWATNFEFSALTIRVRSKTVIGTELQELVRGRRWQHVNRVVDASSAETIHLDRRHDDANQ